LDNSILFIDDDPEDCAIMKEHLLEAFGTKIFILPTMAGKRLIFLKLFRENNLPLILLDLSLPEMSGLEVRVELKNLYPEMAVVV
jgi:CheY-like chemotaxis protein